jgi:hypothetical protein
VESRNRPKLLRPPVVIKGGRVAIRELMIQAIAESPDLLVIPRLQPWVLVHDQAHLAGVQTLLAAAASGLTFPVDQPDLAERQPRILP